MSGDDLYDVRAGFRALNANFAGGDIANSTGFDGA